MESSEIIQEIPPLILKNLGDRSYEKRKAAAFEIESIIHQINSAGDEERIRKIICVLRDSTQPSPNSNLIKGGLIGLASCAIGVGTNIREYIAMILPPILNCFDYEDSRVRFYACEALYNVVKAARHEILSFFNEIFSNLCVLYADVDIEVKDAASLLDKLLKEVVTENQQFDIEKFVPLMKKYINDKSPHIRRLLISWIDVMDNVPGIDMLDYLPEFLEGLFDMLSDPHREIRQESDALLRNLLSEIKESVTGEVDINTMINTVIRQTQNTDKFIRITAVSWIREFVHVSEEWGLPYSQLFKALIPCLSDPAIDVQQASENACTELMKNFERCEYCSDICELAQTVCDALITKSKRTRIVCLKFTSMLFQHSPLSNNQTFSITIFHSNLLSILLDDHDDVSELVIKILLQYARSENLLSTILQEVLTILTKDPVTLEKRGPFLICSLCRYEKPEVIYTEIVSILQIMKTSEYYSKIVEMIMIILLEKEETSEIRCFLRSCFSSNNQQAIQLYSLLFDCCCINPITAISLCWLVEDYAVADAIASSLSQQKLSLSLLLQADHLLQLLDGPIFLHLRLHLIDRQYIQSQALIHSIYQFMMLIPESDSYLHFVDRLKNLQSLYIVLRKAKEDEDVKQEDKERIDIFKQKHSFTVCYLDSM